ncbi:MAG: hypothetical protein ACRDO1_00190 [Nocardioidaceae bacterium]
MTRRLLLALAMVFVSWLVVPGVAWADLDCKESPTPDMPGHGLTAFFENAPDKLPPDRDPFAKNANTTIYEQYGFAGLRWNTYDLGCGPDAARSPDGVIGTSISNWMMNAPLALAALTASVTEVAFEPDFLDVFDPTIARVSGALHDSLFASWMPVVLAALGVLLLYRAKRSSLATSTAAVGWALMIILVATALFRWPIAAGHFADATVTTTLGSVVNGINDRGRDVGPATAVASSVQESIFYRSWLAGELGSTDSKTARKYGPDLFEAQALTWREARILEEDPDRGRDIIDKKRDRFGDIADEIRESDPTAYEFLTGKRSETRVGYAFLATLATFLALPFLLISSLLLLGSFLIVRLAVMLFPAFATLGVFPSARGIVLGVGRTVGAALVNAVIFGIGAAVTVLCIGLILDPASRLPPWLTLVLLPLFSFVMWYALKPFRRLTAMTTSTADPFGEAAGAPGTVSRNSMRVIKRTATAAAATYTGTVGAGATLAADKDDSAVVPDRAEARFDTGAAPEDDQVGREVVEARPRPESAPMSDGPRDHPGSEDRVPQHAAGRTAYTEAPTSEPVSGSMSGADGSARRTEAAAAEGDVPQPFSTSAPTAPDEPAWEDAEEVYAIYRPESGLSENGHGDDAA